MPLTIEQLAPETNIERWRAVYGEQANDWLADLPDIATSYAQRWNLSIGELLEGGSVSVVVGATQHSETQSSTETVLKIYPPWVPTINVHGRTAATVEAAALDTLEGECAPAVVASDRHALLLERITPGTAALDISAQQVATLIGQLSRPITPGTRTIPLLYETIRNRYDRGFSRLHPAISHDLYNSAFGVASILSCVAQWNLIHGDLKPKNVLLRSDGSHAAIDPDPAIGHFAYDAAIWAIDKPSEAVERCMEIADYLKVSPRVIGSWILVLAIPEACLVSEKRAAANLELIKQLAGTSDLERYYADCLPYDIHLSSAKNL